jgi:hypothetical protein
MTAANFAASLPKTVWRQTMLTSCAALLMARYGLGHGMQVSPDTMVKNSQPSQAETV